MYYKGSKAALVVHYITSYVKLTPTPITLNRKPIKRPKNGYKNSMKMPH